jgi:ribosomal protein S12 methylthiotransferase
MDKPLYILTLGCSKNRVDSEVMLGSLTQRGYRLVPDPAEAEVIVVNTCAFIGAAKKESVDAILELAEEKKTGRCETLVVTGCLTQRYGPELMRELPEVDHFLGTGSYAQIGDLLASHAAPRAVIPDPDYIHDATTARINSMPRHTAYLKVSEGCDNTCTFCIIPKLRGGMRSRPIADIVAEANRLAAAGAVEINLIGQDLTAYGYDLPDRPKLQHLLAALCRDASGIRWIRLHYAYPRDLPDALIETIATEAKVVKYLDMPLQHASDRVLRAMQRGRDKAFLVRLLERLRTGIEGLVLRTSMIVGFPGETEAEFNELVAFVREQRFDRLGVFEFSREEGTPSHRLPGQVPARTKTRRRRELMAVQRRISREKNQSLIGRQISVLVEGASSESEHLLAARTYGQAPEVDGITYINEGLAYPGDIVTVEITQVADYDLVGRIVDAPSQPHRNGTGADVALPVVAPRQGFDSPISP